jgi:hypothetical protein
VFIVCLSVYLFLSYGRSNLLCYGRQQQQTFRSLRVNSFMFFFCSPLFSRGLGNVIKWRLHAYPVAATGTTHSIVTCLLRRGEILYFSLSLSLSAVTATVDTFWIIF